MFATAAAAELPQRAIPAVFMRGGTSKGLFFHARDLPPREEKHAAAAAAESDSSKTPAPAPLDQLLLDAMGSPDAEHGRQLDGMGGGISSLSKAVLIGPPSRSDCDVDYTFAQVAVDRLLVDWEGNCGNLSSAVGPFAIDEGLVTIPPNTEEALVRIHQANTSKVIHARFPIHWIKDPKTGDTVPRARVHGDFTIDGVSGPVKSAARVALDFLEPGGAATGKLFPTGNRIDMIEDVPHFGSLLATLIDAANPAVFVRATDIGCSAYEKPDIIESNMRVMEALDYVRREAAVRMGMCADPRKAPLAVPKIAMLGRSLKRETGDYGSDIHVRMISMDKPHKAVPLTGAMCLAAATRIPGTLAHELSRHAPPSAEESSGPQEVKVAHPSGVLAVGAHVVRSDGAAIEGSADEFVVKSTSVFRTARRLMQGEVLIPGEIQ